MHLVTHLDSALRQTDPHRNVFSEKYVRIVSFAETPLEFVQLGWCESCSVSFLLRRFVVVWHNPAGVTCKMRQKSKFNFYLRSCFTQISEFVLYTRIFFFLLNYIIYNINTIVFLQSLRLKYLYTFCIPELGIVMINS